MIDCGRFLDILGGERLTFFAGVPDSLLKDFCACLADLERGITCANEGQAVAVAAGHYLATGEIGVCYLQNSGLGNAYNPLVSLTHGEVYSIPLLLLIGWRGEPGIKDEPQHGVQGEITLPTLETLGIPYDILSSDPNRTAEQVTAAITYLRGEQAPYAFVIRKGTFEPFSTPPAEPAPGLLTREEALKRVVSLLPRDARLIVSTGKLSRELFELRAATDGGHHRDFLTVGSMGHASSIALGVALQQPDRPICCLDGDGAALMHLGAMATIGSQAPANFHHILFNNGVHDSVGGQATAGAAIDFPAVARACGYRETAEASTAEEIERRIGRMLSQVGPTFLDLRVTPGARDDLGRPTRGPLDNKTEFMNGLS